MVKAVHLVCTASVLSGCTPAPPPGAQAALQVVLAFEAAEPREFKPVCVATRSEGVTFDDARRELREEREVRPRTPAESRWHQEHLAAVETHRFDWRLPGSYLGPALVTAPRPPREQAESLSAATRPFIATQSSSRATIELGAIPLPFRAGIAAGCRGQLVLTKPAIGDDIAFVESRYVCGGLCGEGRLYAMRREGNEWHIIAIAETWIS